MPGRILVVDDIATNRIVMKVRLTQACYEVLQADGGAAAIHAAVRERPDIVLLDIMMPDIDGIEVCRRLKTDPRTCDIPVIVVTSARNGAEKLRTLQAGADEVLAKPLDELTLLARVRNLLRARETTQELALRDGTRRALGFSEPLAPFEGPGRVALIAPRQEEALAWKSALQDLCPYRMTITTRAEALALRDADAAPDLFIVAADMERPAAGLRLLTELRSRTATHHCGVIVVVSPSARETAAMALDLGANDLVTTPVDAAETALRLETQMVRKRQADRLRASVKDGLRMAITDPLTGLFNRRYAMPHLSRIAERAAETGRPFALMLLDLDRFKAVNDRHGHAAGDAVLEQVAALLTDSMRPTDLIARIGGEEFLLVMPETTPALARRAAERLRARIEGADMALPGVNETLTVSASIGVAIGDGAETDVAALMARADTALYAAKGGGRNTVTVSPSAA